DGTVRTWNTDGTPRATLTGHTGGVNAVAISPDGSWLASASDDGSVRIWAISDDPSCIAVVRGETAMFGLCWSEPNIVIAGGARGISIFKLSTPSGRGALSRS
ncbi:hypothetical protein ABT340_33120, partial [Streptosporangium sp. NPDC000239]